MIQVIDADDPVIKIISLEKSTAHLDTIAFFEKLTECTYQDATNLKEHLYSESDIENADAENEGYLNEHPHVAADIKRILQIMTETEAAYIRLVK
jgi:hypothetical protein